VSSSTESSAPKASSSRTSSPKASTARGFVRRLLADTRGTATTETVIMIPMFAIVWGSIFFIFIFFQRTIQMRSMTRGHTWQYSYIGCHGSGPDTQLSTEGGSLITAASSGDGGVDDIISGLFALGTGHGRRTASVTRPTVLGGGSMSLRDDLYVLCNDEPRGNIDYLGTFVSRFFGF
jgi:hypothetical protein